MEQENKNKNNEKKNKYVKIRKRVTAAIMTACLVLNFTYYAFVKPNCVYATAAVAGYVAGETILSLLVSGMTVAGIYHTVKTQQELDELTKVEQEEYYEEITLTDKGWMKELYDNGFFEGTEIEDIVRASIYDVDGTSALDRYREEQNMKEKLKVVNNSNKEPDKLPDGSVAISAGIIATWNSICNIGADIKKALDKAVEAKKNESTVTLPFTELPDCYGTSFNYRGTKYWSTYVVVYQNDQYMCRLISSGYEEGLPNLKTDAIGYSTSIYAPDSGARNYVWNDEEKIWELESSKSGSYFLIGGVDYDGDYRCVLYNNCILIPYSNAAESTWKQMNPFPFETVTDPEEDINRYLADYKLAYSEGYQDAMAQTAADTQTKLIINDNPEKIEQYLNVPLSQPLANPDPSLDAEAQLQQGIESSMNKLPAAITETNTETLPELAPEDQESFKEENPSYRLNDYEVDGLEDVFPFCIPFDLFRCIQVLCAEPEAPRWEFPFKFERWGIDETIVLDLEKFESVAQISRWIETLIFTWMLASKTKAFMFS